MCERNFSKMRLTDLSTDIDRVSLHDAARGFRRGARKPGERDNVAIHLNRSVMNQLGIVAMSFNYA